MGAGAGMDIGLERHSIIFSCFQKLPFSDVEKQLWNYLVSGHSKMSDWNKDYLLKEGNKSPIAQ